MNEEMWALENNQTWKIFDLPHRKKDVGCKSVFTVNYRSDNSLERYKAKILVKGYTQTYSVDYHETFASVAKMRIMRVLVSLAANFDWYLE